MVFASDLNPDNFELNLYKGKDNKKSVYINQSAASRRPVSVQLCGVKPTEMLRAPFGINEPMPGTPSTGRDSMELAVPQTEDDGLRTFFKAMDERCIKFLCENGMAFFGKPKDDAIVRDGFTSPFRDVETAGRSNLLRVKVPPEDQCDILVMHEYDEATSKMRCKRGKKDSIHKDSRLMAIVDVSAMWSVARDAQYGYSLTCRKIIVDGTKANMMEHERQVIVPDGWEIEVEEGPADDVDAAADLEDIEIAENSKPKEEDAVKQTNENVAEEDVSGLLDNNPESYL